MKREENNFKINYEIKSPKVRIVGDNVDNSGDVFSHTEAMNLAEQLGMDLIEISPNAVPPVVKIMDYKKFIYDTNKKKKELEKKQNKNNKQQKTLEFTVNIAENDLKVKEKMTENFLIKGHEVKLKIKLKGRELSSEATKDKSFIILAKISENLTEIGKSADIPKIVGKDMILIIKPKK